MPLDPVGLAPLLLVVVIVGIAVTPEIDESWDRTVTRHARRFFGRYVDPSPEREELLDAAYVEETYHTYAARTLLYTALAGLAGAVTGVYAFGGALLLVPAFVDLLMGLPRTMVAALGARGFELVLTETETLIVVTAGGIVGGLASAGTTYLLRWEMPRNRKLVRARQIEEGMPRMVAFMYALSRGGVAFPDVLRTLASNSEIYGEGAREIGVAVREMDLFGRDMITAVRQTSARTPSGTYKTFTENLASVLQSGQNLSTFLHEQYQRYQEEAAERQEEILELLATIAEAYVTVLVAAVLFLMTILMVFGLTLTDTLWLLKLLAYLVVPLANVGFMVYLSQKLESLGIASNKTTSVLDDVETATLGKPRSLLEGVPADGDGHRPTDGDGRGQGEGDLGGQGGGESGASGAVTDGGVATLTEAQRQLRLYDRVKALKGIFRAPLETLRWYPSRILYLTVPLALLYLVVRVPTAFASESLNLHFLDDVVVHAVLFVLGTFAVARELYSRRVRKIEAATPELLERLASLNEAGMTVVESLKRVRGSDVGVLTPEVERMWADVSLGANVEDALVRFGRRVPTTAITRVVTLVTNAMRASGKLGPVLRIAATQARADHRMRRQRRQQMLTYLVVIYIAFLVFLVIIAAVQEVLVPSLPSQVPTPENTGRLGIDAGQFARLGRVDKAAYTLVFFHTALVQAVFSGFVGGQLGEGSLRDGAKHAAIMLGVTYVVFLVLSSPVASITMAQPDAGEATVTVDSVSLSEGGFVAIHAEGPNGTVLGHSQYLQQGTHSDVTIQLNRSLRNDTTVAAVAYLDSDGDRDLRVRNRSAGAPPPPPGRTFDDAYPSPGSGRFVVVEREVD